MSDAAAFPALAQRASLRLSGWLLGALLLSALTRGLTPLALAGPLGLGLLLFTLRAHRSARSCWPDLITGLRVLLTSLLAWYGRSASATSQLLLVLAIFALDGVDGLIARRSQACSLAGAHFDMESDAYLVLVVCVLDVCAGLGPWALTGGLLRYAYVLCSSLLTVRGEAPRTRFGRYAFAISLGSLSFALLPQPAAPWLAALGTAVLCWSFARSFYWSFRAA